MTARRYKTLRLWLIGIWLVLALVAVVPVLAQDGGGTPTPPQEAFPQGEGTVLLASDGGQTGQPQDLDDVAVRLMPLLVGAALIERTLEFLFNWVERALIDASHTLNDWARRLTGLVQIDLHKAWNDVEKLAEAMLKRDLVPGQGGEGDPDSPFPEEWPLAKLELQLVAAKSKLETAQKVMNEAMDSPHYVARKKMAAAYLSMGMGILLALIAHLRLFDALGVSVADWFEGPFDLIDLLLAGILMGLGTDWVHQVIGLLVQGKGLLGRAGGGSQLDPDQVRQLALLAIQSEFAAQSSRLRDDVQQAVSHTVARSAVDDTLFDAVKPGTRPEPPADPPT